MDKRNHFIDYVKNGGKKICSPQIGANAGFDTKLAGKKWISDTTIEDTIAAVDKFDIIPLINIGLCDLGCCNSKLIWEEKLIDKTEEKIIKEYFLKTPVGTLYKKSVEERYNSPYNVKYAVASENDLEPFEYYLDVAMDSDFSVITEFTRNLVLKINGKGALSVQWPLQPYELLCFPNTVDTVLLTVDCPERFKRLMDKIVRLDIKLLEAVSKGEADFVFLGAPGREMLSPSYYEQYIVPYSEIITSVAHSYELMVYSHICSPIEPLLTIGFYNRMGIDLFETLSQQPVGNIISLEDAMNKINAEICTRGNLGLDILINSNPRLIKQETYKILEATKERKHIIAASDYLLYQVPEENVHAMCEAVNEYNGLK